MTRERAPMQPEPPRSDDKAALLRELQHRVRNTLAGMREIVRRSAESAETLDDYVMHLQGRLDAMARVQSAFIRDPTGGIDLGLLVADEIATARAHGSTDIQIDGLPVRLHPRAAETMGLALHELVTNAIKFGALAVPSGRIAVTWRTEQNERGPYLDFAWTESGVALADTTIRRHGFGFVVLKDMVPHNLNARTELCWPSDGLTFRLALPLTSRNVVGD